MIICNHIYLNMKTYQDILIIYIIIFYNYKIKIIKIYNMIEAINKLYKMNNNIKK